MIAVTIPAFNRTTYLRQAVDSVLQERAAGSELDLVVVDNCSTNPEMHRLLAGLEASGLRVVRNERNLGVLGNWNRCIELAQGDWMHLLHDDDYINPGFYRTAEEAIRRHHAEGLSMVVSGATTIDSENRRARRIPAIAGTGLRPDFSRYQSCANLVSNPAVVFRRSFALAVGGFGGSFPSYVADWNMWFKLACRGPVFVSGEIGACYRIHESSGTLHENTFSIAATAAFVDEQVQSSDRLEMSNKEKYRYTVGFGRHLIRLYRRSGNKREALRLAKETIALDGGLVNRLKVAHKLHFG